MGKIVCVGRNYVEHIKELHNEIPDEPVYFMKPFSAISGSLVWQKGLHYEGEIAFLYEKGRFAKAAFGFDLTLREVQSRLKRKGLPWERAKAFKNSAVFSPFVPIKSWENLELRLYRNGKLVQKGDTSLMIFNPDYLLKDIDEIFGLEDGDIVMSGTPKGVGEVGKGDVFEGELWQNGKSLVKGKWKAL